MKKLLVLSLTCLLLAACGDKDDDNTFEKKGYLTSLDEAKKGIVGVWELETQGGGVYYYGYDANKQICAGFKPDKLDQACSKYEILVRDNIYYTRTYSLSNNIISDRYVENIIKILNNTKCVKIDKEGNEHHYTRVK